MKKIRRIFGVVILWLVFVGIFQVCKPLPKGVDYAGVQHEISAEDVRFLYDLTYEKNGNRVHEQQIFDRVFAHIQNAQKYILVDMFLFNSHLGKTGSSYRSLSDELVENLIDAKKRCPDIRIDVITDPINIVYGGSASPAVERLKAHAINVIITDLDRLRDSNPLYSVFWRTFIQWFGNSPGGFLPHPFSSTQPDVSLRSYLALINFKANHRKVFMADTDDSYVSLVMSANPHDASAAHSNVAIEVKEKIAPDLFKTEKAVASFSGGDLSRVDLPEPSDENGNLRIGVLTEEAIYRAVINEINDTASGDNISIAMFYLSERHIIEALKSAAARGVEVCLILDPNKDAFGYEKKGIPNRPVAHELVDESAGRIQVRWYDTKGEQFHSKILFIERAADSTAILGSGNLTRRNLRNYNLELDVMLEGEKNSRVFADIRQYFDRIWHNRDGVYTTGYDAYRDESFVKTVIYNIQERAGLSSF